MDHHVPSSATILISPHVPDDARGRLESLHMLPASFERQCSAASMHHRSPCIKTVRSGSTRSQPRTLSSSHRQRPPSDTSASLSREEPNGPGFCCTISMSTLVTSEMIATWPYRFSSDGPKTSKSLALGFDLLAFVYCSRSRCPLYDPSIRVGSKNDFA